MLNPGDIAIVSYNSDGNDDFAWVPLVDLSADTIINFTDSSWQNTAFRSTEHLDAGGPLVWSHTSLIPAGTVIRWNGSAWSIGTGSGSALSLSTSGDQIFVFTGSTSNPNFIYGINVANSGWLTSGTSNSTNTSNIPSGLSTTAGTAFYPGDFDNGYYSGPTAGTRAELLSAIANPNNWTKRDSNGANTDGSFPSSSWVSSLTINSGAPSVNLSVSSNTGSEAGQTLITVTATASSAVSGDQTVNLGIDGSNITAADYTLSSNVITIPNGATSGSVTFTIADDALVEGLETAVLTLSNPSSGIALGSTTNQSISITDNDGNASLVTTITVPGNATDLYPTNGGSGGANVNRLGGFGSDFFYDYRQNVFYGLADRGAGGGVLSYNDRIEKIGLTIDPTTGTASGFQVLDTIALTVPAGVTLNGVTTTQTTPLNGLNPTLLNGNGGTLGLSLDPEGLVVGVNGHFFISDEYGPSVYEFDATGSFLRALTPPSNVIPRNGSTPYYAADGGTITAGRQENRGYEGLAISPDGTKLFAVFQDPLVDEGGRNSRNVRIVRYDIATGQSDAQYVYQLEAIADINNRIPGTANDFAANAQGRNIGISSLVAVNDHQLLVVERDNRGVGVDDPAGNAPIGSKRVFQIELTGATDVSSSALGTTLPAGVTPVSKSLFLDLADAIQGSGQKIPEKIEGLAIGPQLADGSFSLLVATDNDFSVTQNSSNTQFDVYSDGTQQPIDAAPPASGATLLPSYVYAFKLQAGALDVTPVFDFSTGNYSVTEGNTAGFSTNATVRITRRGDVSGTDSVQLKLSDGTATGGGATPANPLTTGLNSSQTPYIVPVATGVSTKSILTVGDTINGYKMVGIPDGLGAFDNGDGTFTLLMDHELGNTSGAVRAHGGKGAFISSWVINKTDLSVVSGGDLIQNVYTWNAATQSSNTTPNNAANANGISFNRFCSADLPAVTAFYNPATGLGSQERIFMDGEEGGSTGYQLATIATGVHKGDTYVLGKFDLSSNGSGLTGVGAWENALANPFAQDKTIVIGNNDGGTGIMSNAVAVYVGTKTNTGSEIDKAGLTNGTLKFINVANNAVEIADATTRTTNIASGTAFTLSSTASTTFSRPEDGAWDPLHPNQYYFVTTDRLDQVADGTGTQVGRSRLWRLNFTDITNPDLGGTIDLLLDGTEGQNMLDNMTIDKHGHILLQEDVGNAAHNGKIWQYNIATDTLKQLTKHDSARFGDVGVAATSPFNQDEESSGIIDVQDILGPGWFLTSDQAHYSTGISPDLVEGGQLLAVFNPDTYKSAVDYNNTPITVTFNPGETFKDVQIPIAGDVTPEANETVNLSLANPSTGTVIGTKQPSAVLTITNDDQPPSARIHDIQGAAHRSPLEGQTVTNVPGIVTAIASNGFYLQDPNPDNDDRTSEGIFVFTSSRPTLAIGDYVQVSGKVSEFRPGNNANNLTTTEIVTPTINKISSGNTLPAAIRLGNGGRTIPTSVIENDATNVETSGTFDPAQDGIDFYESLEGMRVQINNPVATSPTNNFGEVWVLADNGTNATSKTARGGSLITSTDFNPERIQIDDNLFSGGTPKVSVGAQLGTIVGVVDYNFNNYEVLPTVAPTVITPSSLTKEVTTLTAAPNQLTVATFNVENLDPKDGSPKFNSLADRIVNNLKSPDILSVEEIQDSNGPTNDSVVDASVTYQTLIDAIAAAGGPTYQYRQIDPVDDQDGGEPGGNIRVGFLFNPNRVQFVDRSGGGSTTNTTVSDVNGIPQLSASPGRIVDTNPGETDTFPGDDFASSRKPLVGEFTFNGESVFVVANHFNSKGGDQPLYGPNQPPTLTSENQRIQQAIQVKNFVQSLLAIDPNANIVVAGDLNDFEFSNPLNILKSAGLNDLIETLPANERYTYNFEGNAQTLDHILASNNLLNNLNGFDVVHINSEFYDQVSDHDPSVARFRFNSAPVNTVPGTQTATQDSSLVFSAAQGNAISIFDADAGSGLEQAQLSVTSGFLTLSTTNGLTVLSGNNNSAAITIQGTLSDLNSALNGLKFTPDVAAVLNGNATFTILSNDLGNTGVGGAKTDTDTVAITVNPANLILSDSGNNTIQGTTGADTIYARAGNDKVYGNGGNDIFLGEDGNDELYGGAGNDYFDAGNGNDKIYAYGGNNTILGRAGNDTIEVGNGINFIDGGLGNDTIRLGGGKDTIVLTRGNGIDTIYNYSAGSTRFNLTAGLTYNDLTVMQDGSNTLIRAGSEKLASLMGVQASSVTSSSFIGV
jgi:predicted extracellular nuclease